MCGITGIIGPRLAPQETIEQLQRMNAAIAHRGPNSEGIWHDDQAYLGHRRLSIIDLSEAGNQPFHSYDGRYVIIYNGELYNYRALKLELQRVAHGSGHTPYLFRTNSDTEVMLAAYMRWGKDCLQRFNGMYAFAIWDTQEQSFFMARDRMGIKPLYYYYKDQRMAFASEIRAILKSGITRFSINQSAIADYLQYQTVHAPATIVNDVQMLLPGHYMEWKKGELSVQRYWDLQDHMEKHQDLSYDETCQAVNQLLSAAVERRLVADVPFGAFLSGGIDSSAVVGLMSKVSAEKIRTFSVTFDESEFSEAVYAKAIAKKFNTEHHEIRLQPDDFLQQLPEALQAMDHPSGDGPNTYIVSKATKQAGITMALSGLGGDEVFAGYDIFKRSMALQGKRWLNMIPQFMRQGAAGYVRASKKSIAGDKMAELLALKHIDLRTAYPLNRQVFSTRQAAKLYTMKGHSNAVSDLIQRFNPGNEQVLSLISTYEMSTYMQNVLLRDTDQMSMAVALEVRVPFLDYQLVEFVLGVRDRYKYPHTPKKLLTDALGDLLPSEIIHRPKMGFVLPWKDWLRKEMKSFCETQLHQLEQRGIFHPGSLEELWQRFLQNDPRVTWSRVWHLIVLENWLSQNGL